MAERLYGVGSWAVAHRRRVLALWVLLLAVVGGLGVSLHGTLSSVFTVPGIESQQAQDLLQKQFPEAAGGTARIVFAGRSAGAVATPSATAAITAGLTAASKLPGVVAVTQPDNTGAVSKDGRVAYADVVFRALAADIPQSTKDALDSAVQPVRAAGLEVEFGGTAESPTVDVGGPGEVVGVAVAAGVLALTLGSLVAAGLPLLTALIGVAIGVLGVRFVSDFVDLTTTATVLATMIGLAVGIDYALFIVSRHREQLQEPGRDLHDSIARATATVGGSVLFAGSTVVIALASLATARIPFLTVMGLAAAGTVVVAVLIAITLVPALLGFAGERLRPSISRRTGRSWGLVWARSIARAPLAVVLVCVLVLIVLALPVRHLRLGLPGNESQPTSSTQHKGYELLTDAFGPGFNATLAMVVDARTIPAAERVTSITELAGTVKQDADVAGVGSPIANAEHSVFVLDLVPRTGPDDQATVDLVGRLRTAEGHFAAQHGGRVYVAGYTASTIDVSRKLGRALPLFVSIIVLLALVLLGLAFRSVLVPVTAVLGFLFSVAASLGAVVWVFQYGHLPGLVGLADPAPVVSFVPVLLIGVLFGLAMDYEVFLVSRMREDFEAGRDAHRAVLVGVQRSGRVVAAAATIMAAVFAGFVFTGDPIVKSIAFALTAGVLIDAFVVRLTLVPALMMLLGRWAWWLPGRRPLQIALVRDVPMPDAGGR